MTGRVKYAKLRLSKPVPTVATKLAADCGGMRPEACDGSTPAKVSKFFQPIPAPPVKETNKKESPVIAIIELDDSDNSDVEDHCGSAKRTRMSPEKIANEPPVVALPKLPKLRRKSHKSGSGSTLIDNFFSNSTPQEDDFEEPRATPVMQKQKTKAQRATRKPKVQRRPKNQTDIRKVFKKYNDEEILQHLMLEHSAADRIDPEQLQLALAMSRSLDDQKTNESVASTGSTSVSMPSLAEDRRIQGIRTTLEQFGFKCKNSYTDYDLNVIFGSTGVRNVKKIKHKRATALVHRNATEVVKFMERQAERLLSDALNRETAVETDPHALTLRTYGSDLFWLAQSAEGSDDLRTKWYVENLVERNPAPVGCLLKDWKRIPGREPTPERDENGPVEKDTANVNNDLDHNNASIDREEETQDITETRSASPDLFADSGSEHEEFSKDDAVVAVEKVSEIEKMNYNGSVVPEGQEQPRGSNLEASLNDETSRSPSPTDSNPCQVNNSAPAYDGESINWEKYANGLEPRTSPQQTKSDVGQVYSVEDNTPGSDAADEDIFLTAPNVSPAHSKNVLKVCNTSSEDIFEDVDPIVTYEVFSSEEAKITTPARLETATGTEASSKGILQEDTISISSESIPSSPVTCNISKQPLSQDRFHISDDEVNYSIRKDRMSRLSTDQLGPVTDDDADATKLYFPAEPELDVRTESLQAKADSILLSSDDEKPDTKEHSNADDTLLYLEGLIKKYNLATVTTSQIDSTPVNNVSIPSVTQPSVLARSKLIARDSLDKDFDHLFNNPMLRGFTQTSSAAGCDSRRASLKRFASDSVLTSSSTPKEKTPPKRDCDKLVKKFEFLVKERCPSVTEYAIEVKTVSPKPKYAEMSLSLLHRELFKYGLKQMKRETAVKTLDIIFETLHPLVDIEIEELAESTSIPSAADESNESVPKESPIESQSLNYSEPWTESSCFKLEIATNDWILPSKPSKKIAWCPVPLHIAFYNLVCASKQLQLQILRYDPIDLDTVYKTLKQHGLRYESNDLIAFLDKRCITFRTSSTNGARVKKKRARD